MIYIYYGYNKGELQMEIGLLKYTIQQIERLKFLFETELKSIYRKSKKGMKDNNTGYAIISYIRTLDFQEKLMQESDSYNNFKKFIERFVEIIPNDTENDKSIKFRMKNKKKLGVDDSFDPEKECIEFEKYMNMPQLFCEETIIMLMVKFEDSISNLLYCLFERFPDKYLSDKTIPYSEIIKLNSANLESYIINNLINTTMRKEYIEWFKIFESHGMSFEKYEIFDDFTELYFRRNLIVHNKSIVNDCYLNGISKTNLKKPKIDDLLLVNEEYVLNAFSIIECVVLSIFIECGKFYRNDEKNDYINEIFNIGFNFLCKEQYCVSEFIFKQLENLDIDNCTKMMSKVNRWISQKNNHDLESIKSEINNTDFSALKDDFLLAKYILLEDYDNALPILEEKTSNVLIATYLEEWPLYKDFRKTKFFEDFKNRHKDIFNVKEFDSSNDAGCQNISYSELQSNLEQ